MRRARHPRAPVTRCISRGSRVSAAGEGREGKGARVEVNWLWGIVCIVPSLAASPSTRKCLPSPLRLGSESVYGLRLVPSARAPLLLGARFAHFPLPFQRSRFPNGGPLQIAATGLAVRLPVVFL